MKILSGHRTYLFYSTDPNASILQVDSIVQFIVSYLHSISGTKEEVVE